MKTTTSENNPVPEQVLLNNLGRITSSLNEFKSEFGTKLSSIYESNSKLESLLETLNKRFDLVEERLNFKKEQPEIKTPLTKINENKLSKEIKILKAEIFKLTEENESLKKYKKRRTKDEQKLKSKVNDFEIFRCDSQNASENESPNEVEVERVRGVREFRLDSNPSHSFHVFKDYNHGFISSKDNDSDNISIRTSKGNNNNNQSNKLSQAPNKLTDQFQFGFLNANNFSGKAKKENKSAKIDTISVIKKASVDSNDSIDKIAEYESTKKDKRNSSDKKRMSIKNVKNFCDFQQLLRNLKTSLNASIYAQFNDNIEENIQELNNLLDKYRQTDTQIENFYQSVKEKNCQTLRKEISRKSDDPEQRNNSSLIDDRFHDDVVKREIFKRLIELRKTSNFCIYEQKLIQIQSNPSEFDSFLYTIKSELEKRERMFMESQKAFADFEN